MAHCPWMPLNVGKGVIDALTFVRIRTSLPIARPARAGAGRHDPPTVLGAGYEVVGQVFKVRGGNRDGVGMGLFFEIMEGNKDGRSLASPSIWRDAAAYLEGQAPTRGPAPRKIGVSIAVASTIT